jgi:hypothetical protein
MTVLGPWLTLAGLGAFHGLNPAMGWLFAVALGLHRRSRQVVLLALAPMALGHAVSIWLVAAAVMALGAALDATALRFAAAAMLLGWAAYHAVYGHSHRVRVGMTTGLAGLALWSFLMATTHGAGLMLVPALMPLCGGEGAAGFGHDIFLLSLAAVAIHVLATLIVTGVIAFAVYSWIGLEILRRSWINFDLLWTGMLAGAGLMLIIG